MFFIECFPPMFYLSMFFTSMFSLIAREKIKGNEISISSSYWRFFTLFLCEILHRREDFFCSLAHIDLNSFSFFKHQNSMIKSTLETIYSSKAISEEKNCWRILNCDKKVKQFSKKSFSFANLWKLLKFIFRSILYRVKINFILHNFLL